jgi:hypothetical protein
MGTMRFGVVRESVRGGADWLDFARRVEDSGIGAGWYQPEYAAAGITSRRPPDAPVRLGAGGPR